MAEDDPRAAHDGRARRIAWEILQRVERGGFADILLGHRLESSRLDPRDQGLVTRLVYSTLAWQAYLDHLLQPFSRRPIAELDIPIRTVLRMALLQVCVLTRIPAFAAVTTAVELAKSYRGGTAAGFVNAVLRKAITAWQTVALPPRDAALVAHLAVRWSHPEWLVTAWMAMLGDGPAEELLIANNQEAPTVLRVNGMVASREATIEMLMQAGYGARASDACPAAIRLEAAPGAMHLPGFADGMFSVQGEASQLIGHLVAPLPGMRVLDLCAAPGGKSLHVAELMRNDGLVVARDINARGIAQVRAHAKRLGLSIIDAHVGDAIAWGRPQSPERFDRVIVDAPCSGLGTLRSHPELRWRRSPEKIDELAQLQFHILRGAAASVAPGGALIYSTCTLTGAENDEVVSRFLASHPPFDLEDPRPYLPLSARSLVDVGGRLRTFPHRDDMDGFFAVRLKRR